MTGTDSVREPATTVEVTLTRHELIVLADHHERHAQDMLEIAAWDDWSKEDARPFVLFATKRKRRARTLRALASKMAEAREVLP